ncbi:restriction endonuclease [Gardnerella vaginalis]|nr:restriction endonuclease [Gardnerella vaginalis]
MSRYCPNGVEYKKIGDIAFISTGSKLRDIQESHSLYEYINAGTTNSGYSLDWNCDGDVVTTPSRGQGGIGYVGYQKNKFWLGPLCYKIVGNADFVLNKYLYYYLSNNSYEILSLKKDGGVPAINKSDLEELILSVPPLEVQRQIVQILDRFDTICSDLNIGLPAEIEARQKQYEFYRDKLLSFKQL